MEEKQSHFEGWAIIELFGHAREAGYVSTEYFGSGALFRVEVPALEEREVVLDRPEWIETEFALIGSKVSRGRVEGRTRFIGPGAVYAMNPCSEEAARKALEAMTPRKVKVIELVSDRKALRPPDEDDSYMEPEDDPYEDEAVSG